MYCVGECKQRKQTHQALLREFLTRTLGERRVSHEEESRTPCKDVGRDGMGHCRGFLRITVDVVTDHHGALVQRQNQVQVTLAHV